MSGNGIAANVSARSERKITEKGRRFAARKAKTRQYDAVNETAHQQKKTLKKRRTDTTPINSPVAAPASAPAPKPVISSVIHILNPPAVFKDALAQAAVDARRIINPIRIPADVLQRNALSPTPGRLLNLDTLPLNISTPLLLPDEYILALHKDLTRPPLSPFSEAFPEMARARSLSPFSILEEESELTTKNYGVELPVKNAPKNTTPPVAAAAQPVPGQYEFDSLTELLDGIHDTDSPSLLRPKPVTPQPAPATPAAPVAPATPAAPVEDIFGMGAPTGSTTVFKTLAESAAERAKPPMQITPDMITELGLA